MVNMVACSFGGYCAYKQLGTVNSGCSWGLFCDFQAPRDSRQVGLIETPKQFDIPVIPYKFTTYEPKCCTGDSPVRNLPTNESQQE
jgi:hypothetical protein